MVKRLLFILMLVSAGLAPVVASAHRSPDGCSGSGLGISLFASASQVHSGDTIIYSADVFDGFGSGPVVCDATNIQAFVTTPDGVSHTITLLRTSLSNGEHDFYANVATYVAKDQDIANGALTAIANDTGDIHQNDTDSQGGGNQGVNVLVIALPPIVVPPVVVTPVAPSCSSGCGNWSVSPPATTTTIEIPPVLITPVPVPVLASVVQTPSLPTFPTSGRTIDIFGIANSLIGVLLLTMLVLFVRKMKYR